jgi:fatty-acyl-CoA synthase
MPATALRNAVAYEDWLAEVDDDFTWRSFDENTAAGMCYTSGTTGDPKGVVYSHRSNTLHALLASLPDMLGLSSRDVVMPVVPMFHANCWSLIHSAPMTGAALVMPGARMDGASLYELLETEQVTLTAAVPTIWLMLLQHLEATGAKLTSLKRVVIGGSAAPRMMIQKFADNYGVDVLHAWGMTELSPLGSIGSLRPEVAGLTGEALLDIKSKQGHAPFGVEMKITDDAGKEQPWDGKTFGRLKVRGPASPAPTTATMTRSSTGRGSSTRATSPPSTATPTWPSPTVRKTSSSPAASGYPPSRSRISPSAIPMSPRPPSSASRIRNGTNGRS